MNRRLNLPGIASGLFSVLIGGQALAQLNDHVPPAPAASDALIQPVPLVEGYPSDVHPDALDLADPPVPGYLGPVVVPGVDHGPNAWQPGGYSMRTGRPYYYTAPGRDGPLYWVHNMRPTPWAIDHSSYQYHFGPGFYRHAEGGAYRFPYYTYRAPWYFPGHPIYNRDTNRPW